MHYYISKVYSHDIPFTWSFMPAFPVVDQRIEKKGGLSIVEWMLLNQEKVLRVYLSVVRA